MMPLQRQWDKRLIVRIIHQQPCFQRKSVAIGNPKQHVRNTSHRGSKQQWRSCVVISLTIACSRYIYNGVILRAHPGPGESHIQRNTAGEVATTSPPFLQGTIPIARSLCECWTRHDLHILVTASFCCDRKSREACFPTSLHWLFFSWTSSFRKFLVCGCHVCFKTIRSS